ncbi:MAG: GNAT family N-acetyltransferase [Rhodobacteraceae bacterium]|nr:GNAT family N-acetyltransferase [Paracoccaceae bacterium]
MMQGRRDLDIRFETERLAVRPCAALPEEPAASDRLEGDLRKILTPAVLAHLPGALQFEVETDRALSWLEARLAESAIALVYEAGTGGLLGVLILARAPGSDATEVHLGYLFGEFAWGRGYATELLRGLVEHLRGRPGTKLWAGVDQANPASARVLEKVGFTKVDGSAPPGTEFYVWDAGAA